MFGLLRERYLLSSAVILSTDFFFFQRTADFLIVTCQWHFLFSASLTSLSTPSSLPYPSLILFK